MVTLEVSDGERTVTLTPGTVLRVGRDAGADFVVRHPDVSRRHAVFYFADGWCVADEGSLNGIHVDGVRTDAARLSGRAEVTLGSPGSGPTLIAAESAVAAAPHESHVVVVVPVVDAAPGSLEHTVLGASGPQPFRGAYPAMPTPAGATTTTVGKAPDNDIVIDDIHVSRHHARVTRDGSRIVLEDLGSLNGTFVNATAVHAAVLEEGDRVTVGNADFVVTGGGLVAERNRGDATGGLEVAGLRYTVGGGKALIDGVEFTARRGTLTAVIGPSGAGKSTLSRLLSGISTPAAGRVDFDGFDLQRDYQAVKSRIGLVPQEDVVHRQLSLQAALRYAASLRLAGGLDPAAKRAQVVKVTEQLGLGEHRRTRIDRLSGGQRKRASVAMELLTEPALLILDEPTSGLDPALDRQVMQTLRGLADGDRTVVVITHSVAYLEMCDQILVLAPGGLTAYVGPPAGVAAHFGTADWGDIFSGLADDPRAAQARWVHTLSRSVPVRPAAPSPVRQPAVHASGWVRQFFTIAARQANLLVSDTAYFAFLIALPFVIGLMPYVVPGSAGLTAVPAGEPDHAGEPTSVLALLIIGATFIGVSISIRDLVGERAIFLRERAVGILPSAYVAGKLLVFGALAIVSAAIMTWVATWVKAGPETGVMGWGLPTFELFLALALTTLTAMALGLALSAFVSSGEQVMPVLIVVLMVQLVLHGGLIPVLDNDLLNALSKLVPGRWGFSAAASGIGLESLIEPGRPPGSAEPEHDPMWENTAGRWLLNMGVLALFGAVFSAAAWLRLRERRR